MAAALPLPVLVENNANAAVIAERWAGAGRGVSDLVYINLGEGISAGILCHDTLLQGYQGYAGEIGHIVVQPGGQLCNCGNRGCLETVCAIPALIERANREIPLLDWAEPLKRHWQEQGVLTIDHLLAYAGDPASYAGQLMWGVGRKVGIAAANIINLYNPQALIIGGKLAKAGDVLMKGIMETVAANAFPEMAQATYIGWSAFGERAGLYGACALALRLVFASPDSPLWEA